MATNPVLDLLFSPYPKDESCHMTSSMKVSPLKVRQISRVLLRYFRILFACSQCLTVGANIHDEGQLPLLLDANAPKPIKPIRL
jgi:hypothetical protein